MMTDIRAGDVQVWRELEADIRAHRCAGEGFGSAAARSRWSACSLPAELSGGGTSLQRSGSQISMGVERGTCALRQAGPRVGRLGAC